MYGMSEVGTSTPRGDENCTNSNEGKLTITNTKKSIRERKECMENSL